MESILTSIKKLLGIAEEYEQFDTDLIIHINGALMVLNQLGVGPSEGFSITSSSDTWEDFIGNSKSIELIKTYVMLKVKLVFDSNTLSGAAIAAMKETIAEYEWRIQVAVDPVDDIGSNKPARPNEPVRPSNPDNSNESCCDNNCDCVEFMTNDEVKELLGACGSWEPEEGCDCDCTEYMSNDDITEILNS